VDKQGFRSYLQERDISETAIGQHLSVVEQFEHFLEEARRTQGRQIPSAEDLRAFSSHLIAHGLNEYNRYLALARYGRFTQNDELYVAVVELIDGSEALENLYKKLAQVAGEETRDAVFHDLSIPPLGTPSTQKYQATAAVMGRLESEVDAQTCLQVLSGSLRDLEDGWFTAQREAYLESGSLDAYLDRKGREFIAELERIRDESGLFFTQPITDEVIEFVRSHPEIAQGVREGNILYEAKIPYMAQAYLDETDERMKRYYYCHCPWVRESLREGDASVSPTFCQCSAGFHKKAWEVVFDQPLQAEVVESVLKGDPWCKFAIHLPEGI
jgi:hypothetical protein